MRHRSSTPETGQATDPDYPHRPTLPWSTNSVENYTICCPRCGSYRLGDIGFIPVGSKIVNVPFRCVECDHGGSLALIITRHGLMLATD